MATMKIFRETSVPAQAALVPYAMYIVAPAARPDYVEIYVTDSTPAPATVAKRIPTTDDIQAMISASSGGSVQELQVAADIAARDALSPSTNLFVFVVDATDDATVASGGATYLWRNDTGAWVKVSEAEGMDAVLSWDGIQGRPGSTPAQIDAAVAASHGHANKTQIDQIGQDSDGHLTYGGNLPHIGWDSTGW